MSPELALTNQLPFSMTLTGEGGTLTFTDDNDALLLLLTPVIGGGGGVSGPDIYAFAADQG